MKKTRIIKIYYFVALCGVLFTSCNEKKHFEIDLIIGKWVSGTEYYRYDNDGTGVTWDKADDVNENEAQAFKWEFDPENNHLTLIHWMEMTQEWTIPKNYTLKSLDDKTLSYKDKYDSTYVFSRVI